MKKILIFFISFLTILMSFGQNRCSTDEYVDILEKEFPLYKELRSKVNIQTERWIESNYNNNSKSIITIPVVVHVVWNTSAENISDQQIFSQIDVLNADYRRTNVDAIMTPSVCKVLLLILKLNFV